ncbi:MAG: class I mannose-6-phosphate isomerase [Bacteroidales bacterium]|nr:class I mannose-6-phosphate isomerase [Bacteroidales bacterium]
MTKLYPLKFSPILKERVWGGDSIKTKLGKEYNGDAIIGESWELSGVQDDISYISNGFLEGNDINDLIETYLGDLVGDTVYEKYGNEFPLLIKILDIKESLSLQVHPDDEIAIERHQCYGKTECWYILDASPDAKIYLGLNRHLTAQEFYDKCNDETIVDALNVIKPVPGDIIYIKPGTLHAATGGILVAEVQQVSDVTYRVYDWGREHNPKTAREMHIDLAIDCIDYEKLDTSKVIFKGGSAENPYFKIKRIDISDTYRNMSYIFPSFVIYFCTQGEATVINGISSESIKKGEVILIPAQMGEYSITGKCTLLEITAKV